MRNRIPHPSIGRVTLLSMLLIAPALSSGQTITAGKCHVTFPNPLFIPVSGALREVVIDPQCQHVFVTNATTNRVEVISLASGHLAAPIDVGSNPQGLDVTPDGKSLYVATTGANSLSVVDIAQGVQSATISIPSSGFIDDTPFSIAIANNGLAFLSTTFAGSGFGGRILQVNLSNGTVTPRTDFYVGGKTTEATELRASADGSSIGIVAGDISSGPVFAYSAAINQFTPEMDTTGFVSRVATNGGTVLANDFVLRFGPTLQQLGVFTQNAGNQLFDVAVDPTGKAGYRTTAPIGTGSANIDVLDLQRILVTGSLPIGDTIGANDYIAYPTRSGPGHMAVSHDGSLIAVVTDHGVSLVQPNPVNFVQFNSFNASVSLDADSAPDRSRLTVAGSFVTSLSGAGLDLSTQDFTLDVGAYSTTIPAGTFKPSGDGGYAYRGTNGQIALSARVSPSHGGGFGYELTATGVALGGSSLPIVVTLAIGSNEGSATLNAGDARFTSNSN